MKTLSQDSKEAIEDAAAAGILGNLPAAAVEKDFHITDALAELAQLEVRHAFMRPADQRHWDGQPVHDTGIQLVFAGGTCLSKAYGLIQRMSEDVDIKVVLNEPPAGYRLAGGTKDRARLGALHQQVVAVLEGIGFQLTEVPPEQENPHVRDSRRYCHLSLDYAPLFHDAMGALRPQLKVELIHRHPRLPVQPQRMGYLLDQLAHQRGFVPDPRHWLQIGCISIEETLAEKVLSLLRRCAWKWQGHQQGELDATLVRHLYDTERILAQHPEVLATAAAVFEPLVLRDVEEFRGQNPDFDRDPKGTLRWALQEAATHETLRANYEQRVRPLVYAAEVVSYDQAYGAFRHVAEVLIAALKDVV